MRLTPETYSLLGLATNRIASSFHQELLIRPQTRDRYLNAIEESSQQYELEYAVRRPLQDLVTSPELALSLASMLPYDISGVFFAQLIQSLISAEKCDYNNFGRFELLSDRGSLGVKFLAYGQLSGTGGPVLDLSADPDIQRVITICRHQFVQVVAECSPDFRGSLDDHISRIVQLTMPRVATELWDHFVTQHHSSQLFRQQAFGLAYSAYLALIHAVATILETESKLLIYLIGTFNRTSYKQVYFEPAPEFVGLLAANYLLPA
jgi:hypothetical protein